MKRNRLSPEQQRTHWERHLEHSNNRSVNAGYYPCMRCRPTPMDTEPTRNARRAARLASAKGRLKNTPPPEGSGSLAIGDHVLKR